MKQHKLFAARGTSGTNNPRSSYRCRICGRDLTDPISIERGIGRECWDKYLKQKRDYNLFKK